ncbi:uncharacterized protein LMH87_007582 [Akanthomyces muscarius]|uniref:Uncharacterized protein n=1 Tax=Akanthomyces muscarius TaxID=2231603 RepID=A0A9W8QKG4_AKAMU|nr:uncharacterized protein LMH87_007582 [Akanthomyces muscarius]KAJ4161549.1 hypothetical protein LMH87_007582 [Akanthomyces muscarius]
MQALESVLEYGPLVILLPLSIRPALQDRLLSESICIVALPESGRSIQAAHFWSNLSSKVNSASLVSLHSMMNVLFRRTNSLERFDDERPNDPDISSAPWTTPPRSQNLPPLSGSVDSYSDEYHQVHI